MNKPEICAALDTSVVMRLLTGQPRDLCDAARDYLAETEESSAKVFISNLVVLKAYLACQHHYQMPKEEALAGLNKLLSISTFVVHPRLRALLSTKGMAKAKLAFLDHLIHAEAETAGLLLVTFEKAAARLPDVRLLVVS